MGPCFGASSSNKKVFFVVYRQSFRSKMSKSHRHRDIIYLHLSFQTSEAAPPIVWAASFFVPFFRGVTKRDPPSHEADFFIFCREGGRSFSF